MKSENGAEIPKRQTKGSAGYDFYMPYDLDMEIGRWYTIDTGIRFEDTDRVLAEPRWFMQIVPRSGLSFKYGTKIRNTVPIIDQDFRGTIKLRMSIEGPIDCNGMPSRVELDEDGRTRFYSVEEQEELIRRGEADVTEFLPMPFGKKKGESMWARRFKLRLKKNDRFAQGILLPYLVFADEETPVKEREGGYGSTGQ